MDAGRNKYVKIVDTDFLWENIASFFFNQILRREIENDNTDPSLYTYWQIM